MIRGERPFFVAAPFLWNDLPLRSRQASSLSVLKTRHKAHFCSLAFNGALDYTCSSVFTCFICFFIWFYLSQVDLN